PAAPAQPAAQPPAPVPSRSLTAPASLPLVLPSSNQGRAPAPAAPAAPSAPAPSAQRPQGSGGEYVVQQGDSLSVIAEKVGMKTADLKALNGLSNDNIRVGQKLKTK
ncbi:MAG: LysM peptidoglycan-binding domain-containing protein, partial [Deltaproteobacteria bacterium]|nr:LysM peptidoglycan-binding domain-containing protein [Deltaproteobacteria bacterium]